jgi:histidinol-phosphate aminotransferase
VRALPGQFSGYDWAPSTAEIARLAGIAPERVLRFDGNTPPRPPATATPAALADELGRVNSYPHGGYPLIHEAIAAYAGVEPEQVVLGAGADDLILLVARAFAGAGDVVAVADEPTYPLYRVGAWLAGAEVGDSDPVLTFCCRPHNPTGALVELPAARPLVVDEAYFEYAGGETALGLLEEGVIVIRTFSKSFGLAGARIGYALATPEVAAELRARHAPAPVSTLAVALALAGLADPPDVSETVAERERLSAELRRLGLAPTPSWTNFVHVPLDNAAEVEATLLRRGLAVRPAAGAIRITVRDAADDDVLVAALAELV